jgi:hypothetical protein
MEEQNTEKVPWVSILFVLRKFQLLATLLLGDFYPFHMKFERF